MNKIMQWGQVLVWVATAIWFVANSNAAFERFEATVVQLKTTLDKVADRVDALSDRVLVIETEEKYKRQAQ